MYKHFTLTLLVNSLLIVWSTNVWGQLDPSNQPMIEEYAESIQGSDIHAHLTFLADDLLEGRETGERGQKMAALYIKSNFMRMGLQPGNPEEESYFQTYYLRETNIESASLTVGDTTFDYQSDFFAVRGNLPDNIEEKPVFVGYGLSMPDYDNLQHVDIEGQTVLVFAGEPESMNPEPKNLRDELDSWTKRALALKEKGAKHTMLILPDSVFKPISGYMRRRGTQVVSAEESPYGIICISEGMGNYLLSLGSKKPEKIKASLDKKDKVPAFDLEEAAWDYKSSIVRTDIPAENVAGFLEGTDKKDEILIITAHYDHIGITGGNINNGADDDGSGTSAVLELAEAFTKAAAEGNRPRRSILFMTVSGEEKGLLGSAYYTQHPMYPLGQTIANLNIDMIGRVDEKYEERVDSTNYVYLIGSDKLSSELHQISESSNKTFTNITLDYTYNDENDPNQFYYRSDHYNFAKNSIPVIFYFTGVHEDYHRPTDDVPKIKFDKTAKITRLVFATAWELANREDRIVVDSNKK